MKALNSTPDRLVQPRGRTSWIVLLFFLATVALLGGSSRADAVQITVLRPASAVFLAIAIYFLSVEELRKVKFLVCMLTFLAIWMLLQLVPLPPALWHALPGRGAIVEIDRLAGLESIWRPISLVPSRGWNAFASLIVPVSALLLALAMRAKSRTLLMLIAGMGVFDALLGVLQVITGRTSAFYTYAITNRGAPVGLFANENHSAVFSALVLLVVARLGATAIDVKDHPWLRMTYLPAFVIVTVAILISGSRAGFAMGALALVGSAAIAWLTLAAKKRTARQSRFVLWLIDHPKVILFAASVAILLLFGAFVVLNRTPAFEDFFTQNAFADLRVALWPVLQQMAIQQWLVGAGFGTFDAFYNIYEPTALLIPQYVNQAHNDWAQIVIEGGLPTVAILAILVGWILKAMKTMLTRKSRALVQPVFWGGIFTAISVASVVDYPLRAPAFQLVGIWLLLSLAIEMREGESEMAER